MTALQIIIDILLAYAPLNAAIGGRVYPVSAPQKATLPYIVVNRVSEDEGEILSGASGILEARMSVSVVASSAGDADLIGEVANKALRNVTGLQLSEGSPPVAASVTVRRDGSDFTDHSDDRSVTRRVIDYRIEGRW